MPVQNICIKNNSKMEPKYFLHWNQSESWQYDIPGVPEKCPLVKESPQNPNKEMNRRELLNQPMRVQIAGLPHTVIIPLSE